MNTQPISNTAPDISLRQRGEAIAVQPYVTTAVDLLLGFQRSDGYWWFSLEANESIGAEFIFLMFFLEAVDTPLLQGIVRRIQDAQRDDGTWALYHDGPPDLSTTVECYFALKLAGIDTEHGTMRKARTFILKHGGIEQTRIFTRIHLALFGIVPWKACPEMPVEVMLLPEWFPLNIYEFSSWARASIVPLLIVLSFKPIRILPQPVHLDELFCHLPHKRKYRLKSKKGLISWDNVFLPLDSSLKAVSQLPFKPLRQLAVEKAKTWISDHVERVEDIYPALAYAAIAYKTLGLSLQSQELSKPFEALKMFQQRFISSELPALPAELRDDGITPPSQRRQGIAQQELKAEERIHQQCCISPVWDTPWTAMALLEAGVPNDHPALLRAARWLIKKQITSLRGDWSVKCPHGEPGGWAFEFENDYFPDVDDTIQVLHFLKRVDLPAAEKHDAYCRGINWIVAMQNDDGGWGAFDRNNCQELVNKIPFSDHGACLDPSSPDITGRMLELLANDATASHEQTMQRARDYLLKTQEPSGGWFGRWGVNYIYGTWCVLTGLSHYPDDPARELMMRRGVVFLKSIQREDGGWSESPESYLKRRYVPFSESVPSQTAWALMGLLAGGEKHAEAVKRGVRFLCQRQTAEGSWDEPHHTGTGFPGHFYIRYHGYRYFFPLLALARYQRAMHPNTHPI